MRYCKGVTEHKETSTIMIGVGNSQGVVSCLKWHIHKLDDEMFQSNTSPFQLSKELCEENDAVVTAKGFKYLMKIVTGIGMEGPNRQR